MNSHYAIAELALLTPDGVSLPLTQDPLVGIHLAQEERDQIVEQETTLAVVELSHQQSSVASALSRERN